MLHPWRQGFGQPDPTEDVPAYCRGIGLDVPAAAHHAMIL